MSSIRRHLTYANVMATAAVFLALGGGAFAALRLPAHSVGNKQLKTNAVTGSKVRDHSLTGDDLAEIGLANLKGASGTAINDGNVTEAAGACGRHAFSAAGAQPGDGVMLAGSEIDSLSHAMIGAATVTNANKLNVAICAGAGNPISQPAGTIQLRFDTLR
jgi:hypothetical protein